MRQATLCFLIKEKEGQINEICLAMKKRGFGVGRLNGVGGKVEEESVEEAAARETKEEINVVVNKMHKVAELEFHFPHQKEWDQVVHVYLTNSWQGEPEESEEMKPEWFDVKKIPYETMWSDDIHWLPHVINKKLVKAKFVFSEGDKIKEKDVQIVDKF